MVEALEALRLLSGTSPTAALPGVAAEHNLLGDPTTTATPLLGDLSSVSSDTWDAALVQTHLADLLAGVGSAAAAPPAQPTTTDTTSLASGLSQLDKYLSRAWYRAGIPPQAHEDCTQAVYATLLQQLGRAQFDLLVSDVGDSGIRDVFSRETNEGVDFFRAVDMVKKRAQRERVHQSLESVDVPVATGTTSSSPTAWRDALREAIDHSLSPREASLIRDTIMGKTPAEIALNWGVAPKTVSNEKARVLQKLRTVLLTQYPD
jgi:DNA-binding CsgD family transcriptional regulator